MTVEMWEEAIEVTVDCGDHFRSVHNSREAIECLMTSWPYRGGKSFAMARRACLQAIYGRGTPRRAAEAFTAAAKEAGILR